MTKLTREQVEQIVKEACEEGKRPDLGGVNLRGANLGRANFRRANFNEADLGGANLNGADLSQANLSRAYLIKANLSEANLSEANLRWAKLDGAKLDRADLSRANLRGAGLIEADLSRANLFEAYLSGAFIKTDLTEAQVGWTVFADVDLSLAKGLDTVRHVGPSAISIETIYRSSGSISCKKFLEKAGIPPHFIEYVEKTKILTDCLYTSEQIRNWINELKEQLRIYENNLHIVEKRMAQKGAFEDVPDVNELNFYREKIEETKAKIIEYNRHQEKGCPVCAR